MGKKFIVYLLAISMFVGNADYTVLAAEEVEEIVSNLAEDTDTAEKAVETETNVEEESVENFSSDVETEVQNLEEVQESEVSKKCSETEIQESENIDEKNSVTTESEDAEDETRKKTEESLTEYDTTLETEEVTIIQVEMQGVYEYGDSPIDYQKQYGDSVVYSMRSNNVVEYAYQEIMKSYEAGESGAEITVSEYGFSVEDIIRLVGGLKNDHPELYFVNKSFYCTWSGMDVASFVVTYNTSLSSNKFKQSTEDALSVIKPGMSDLEKAIALHDYLTVNCEYDKDRLDDKTIPYISYTAYGVLVEHIAVCQGYALAYKYLLNQAGIDCYMVESDFMNHAWNLIVLDGEFYQVDVTWDDPIRDLVGRARHTYMFRSDSAFENANPSHSNWNVTSGMDIVDYKATSTRYDSAFWADCNSPLVITENDCYYVSYSDKAIKKECFENIGGTGTKVCDIGVWPVWENNNSFWNATFSGLFQVNDRLYYNDKSSIYSVDFDGSNKKTEFTADTSTGYIYGSALRQGKVYYCLRQKPSITANETVLTADICFNTKKYTITFDADNGFVDISHKTVLPNKACGTLPIPKRDGYNFAGWYTERNGAGDQITAETIITQSMTAYAKWEKPVIMYTVTYNMQGHGEQIESETVEEGSKLIEPSAPTAKDYTFWGWYKEKTCQTEWDFAKDTVTKNTTLYAKWVENAKPVITYKVTYNMQGHGEQIESETVEEGSKLIEPSAPTAKDYTFGGWYKEKTCQTAWDFAKDTVTKDTTLYAKWAENVKPVITYNVTYDMQGHGEQIKSDTVEEGAKLIEPSAPTAKDYTFWGWYKEKTCQTEWDFAKDTVTKDTTLYAKWVENAKPVITYKVTYDMQGHGEQIEPDTVEEGAKLIEPSAPTAKDYTFWGWYKEKTCQTEWDFAKDTVTKDTTLYAKWVENAKPVITYKVTYDMQGHGEQIEPDTVEEGAKLIEPSAPTAKDYTFGGWYKEKTCQTEWDFAKDTVTKNTTLYAKWVENAKPVITYNVTYDMQGHGEQVASETVEEGTKLIEPATPVAKDYRFLGWFKEPKCINVWDFTKDTVNNNIILYAGWSYLGNTSTGDLPEDGVPEGLWIAGIQDYTYTGKAIKPQIRVYFKETKLKEGQDYTISYKNNIKAAGMDDKKAPTVTIKGKGNYAGTAVKTFTINKAMLTASNLKAASVYQLNKAYTPIIILNGNVLKDKTDYTLTYKDTNGTVLQKQPTKELGSYIMHIEGKGNCGGSFDFNFKIAEKGSASIEKGTAVVGAIIYGGKNPPTMLSVNGNTLTSSDYTVVFSNTNVKGMATATFIGIGKYTGILKKNFMVIAQPLSINNITVAKSVSYEKGGARPEISVKANKTKLSEGVDYTVSYKDNTKLGNTAKAIVKGRGNYSGSISVNFEIKGKSLNNKNMEIVIPDVVTGKKPLVTIYDTNGKKLSSGSDYETKIDQAKHTVTITGGKNGCYMGTVVKTYKELPADKIITSVKLNKNASGFPKDCNAYTGKAVTLKNEWLTVKAKNTVLPSDCFTLSYVNNVEKGTAVVIVQGKNGYSGTKVMRFKIKAYGLKDILMWFDPKPAP